MFNVFQEVVIIYGSLEDNQKTIKTQEFIAFNGKQIVVEFRFCLEFWLTSD